MKFVLVHYEPIGVPQIVSLSPELLHAVNETIYKPVSKFVCINFPANRIMLRR